MRPLHKMIVGLVLAGGLLGAVGCAKPPVDARNEAEAAMNHAVAAQAETYAAEAMNEAMKLWEAAEMKMMKKTYKEAKAAYATAKLGFEMAAGQVEAGKRAIIEENAAALTLVEKSLAELMTVAANKKPPLNAEVQKTWDVEKQKLDSILKQVKESKVTPSDIKKALVDAKAMIEKWLAEFKK